MGLFSFIKNAGKKLGIGDDDDRRRPRAVEEGTGFLQARHRQGRGRRWTATSVCSKACVADQSDLRKGRHCRRQHARSLQGRGRRPQGRCSESGLKLDGGRHDGAACGRDSAKEPVFIRSRRATISGRSPRPHYGKGKGAKHR